MSESRYIRAIQRATSVEERRKRLHAFHEAIERGLACGAGMPAIVKLMDTDCPEVLVGCTFVLGSAARRGYDLTPAVPGLVHALYFLFRHHVVPVLVRYIAQDPSHPAIVLEAIRAGGRQEHNPDLDRVIAACTDGIPPREWRWGRCGVHTHEGCLTWFNDATGRNWSRQTYQEFRRRGPWAPSWIMKEHEIPEQVWQELHGLLGVPARERRTRETIEAEVAAAVARLTVPRPGEPCSNCAGIPRGSWSQDSLAELMARLRMVLDLDQASESFHQCPDCGRLFRYRHEVDNEIGDSSDQEYLEETDPEEVGQRLAEVALGFEWTWSYP